ncbi:MAG: hypothetical protein AAB611_01040 [Patescibacteria group bacterium]
MMIQSELEELIRNRFPEWWIAGKVEIPKDPEEAFMVTIRKGCWGRKALVISNGEIIGEEG